MKANISLALNAILLIAVIYLFTQQSGTSASDSPSTASATKADETLDIVYIDADSLLNNYADFRKKQEDLSSRQQSASQSLNQRMQSLEKEFRQVQSKVQQGLLTPNQIAAEEQRLGQKQQALMAEQEQLSATLGAEQQQLAADFQDNLRSLMDSLQEARGYDFILQYGQGSSLLGARDGFDITNDVLNILNGKAE
ncbi:MAG: OmpH family outer membrane protein [Phaeodactylibacter sp.]|uniref:OmpH family outer membrane protein n=1 Tax=Phaeodactylibacter sp. TaxID=1940289 RepID=UPI0032EC6F95